MSSCLRAKRRGEDGFRFFGYGLGYFGELGPFQTLLVFNAILLVLGMLIDPTGLAPAVKGKDKK